MTKLTDEMRDLTPILEIMTSRTLTNAKRIMENAARGKFPCKDPVEIPVLNHRYIWQTIRRRHEANKRDLVWYLDCILTSKIIDHDWEIELLNSTSVHRFKIKESKLEVNKRFMEEQKALHLPKK